MTRNKISKLENRAFENCVNITMLDLSHNELTEIPKFAFDELTYATEMTLAYNALTNFSQVSKGFCELMIQLYLLFTSYSAQISYNFLLIFPDSIAQYDRFENSQCFT